jgi:hypothetical protein
MVNLYAPSRMRLVARQGSFWFPDGRSPLRGIFGPGAGHRIVLTHGFRENRLLRGIFTHTPRRQPSAAGRR